ncbi:putative Protein serine/threonine kinase [Rhodotorula toruloides ATCC 204091]|uniref:Serine/threonine-protein kinase n=1 Tax=Rhodotorula toruloides TaxID=5286 RepID=A0A0K3C6A6_RHOTO|nr:putative Protein serine/threonine kinase [Rhodotorula toruloides ATCC 204091]KAK4333947.1 Cell cycle serine/threonine-protein kinase CDC5/MSD2 [Rhodotorula toruloides]PRQ76765.1 hypothetical protein AAT19DRAFT_12183 [Rhodotorula toruloides]
MLALQPQQPVQPTRRAIPLSRSSSSLRKTAPAPASTRQPLSSVQPGQPQRDTDTLSAYPAKVARGQREEASARTRPSSTIAPQPPLAPSTRTVQARQRVDSKHEVQTEREAEQPEPKEDDKGKEQAAAKSSRNKLTDQWDEPPAQIRRGAVHLERGRLLGEGGFARVYLCTEPDGKSYKAMKVIHKQQLKSTKTKSKLFAEIKIHQAMQHPNVIAFECCFEDEHNVYMQLELCARGSLLDLLRIRKRFSEPESRFYLTQLVGAVDYLHSNSVIHRDLKLGNLMVDGNMNLKVGDFGLAALVKFPGERKKTICGTPNYIAPEILFESKGTGHSFEVDIWSIGVILYTLLIGKPPFQTKDVKNIYRKIRDNAYTFPSDHCLSPESTSLISSILQPDPLSRPSLPSILFSSWFITGPFPSRISSRALDPDRAKEMCEEWRYMTKRQSWDNFRRCKRKSGIVEVEEGVEVEGAVRKGEAAQVVEAVSQALPTVAEAVEEEDEPEPEPIQQEEVVQPPKKAMRMVRPNEEREAKGRVEKEVRAATAPDSPISELLRSARKPLMVSPSSRAIPSTSSSSALRRTATTSVDSLQQRLAAASVSDPPAQAAPSAATDARRTDSAAAQPSRHRRAGAQSPVDVPPAPPPAAPAPPPAKSATTTTHPSRSLYDSTWRSFDTFLSCTSLADVSAVCASFVDALPDEDELRASKVFVSSWVDYTHRCGTAYSLTDGSAGVYFNDSTTMVLSPDKEHFDYIANRHANVYTRRHYALSTVPEDLDRKAYLLRYFEDYMAKTLRRNVEWQFQDVERLKNMDFLVKYYRMKNAILFKLSNDVLQFNFFDHFKLIITSSGLVISVITPTFTLETYTLPQLFRAAAQLGHYSHPTRRPNPSSDRGRKLADLEVLIEKVAYCKDVLRTLVNRRTGKEAEGEGGNKE